MTRQSLISQDAIIKAKERIDRTHVILSGVANYDELETIHGASFDLDMMSEIFTSQPDIALFEKPSVDILDDPTNNDFRECIANYTQTRTARGDILILYFSGHGCILPSGSFGFCLQDTRLSSKGDELFPISIVSIEDVLSTLSVSDIHPVFIIDACYSSAISSQSPSAGSHAMEDTLRKKYSGPFALLASSSSTTKSVDTPSGGPFTQALYNLIHTGLKDDVGQKSPYITLDILASPLREELTCHGVPLPRCVVGDNFPLVAIAKNKAFRQQTVRFSPYFKRIILFLWNNGAPREATRKDLTNGVGPGAYGNHSKLSLNPWGLVESTESNKKRMLTRKGMKFAQGDIKIPKIICKNPITGEWKQDIDTPMISVDDI